MSIPQQQDPVKNRSSVEEQRPANGHTSPRGTNVNDPPKQLIAVEVSLLSWYSFGRAKTLW